tara:strand:+ start:129 stop:644 length:516 start_codon:yes stop_codon:yes gene_type:complete
MKLCISTGISTFLIVLYCCIGIDFLPEFIDEELMDHPLFRFVVLALMALVFCYDHYIAILIGFSYMLTKFTLLNKNKKGAPVVHAPVSLEETVQEGNPYSSLQETVIENDKQIPDIDLIENNFDNDTVAQTDFTSDVQFKSAQSNIASDIALKTEVRTWDNGYGTQGGYKE